MAVDTFIQDMDGEKLRIAFIHPDLGIGEAISLEINCASDYNYSKAALNGL